MSNVLKKIHTQIKHLFLDKLEFLIEYCGKYFNFKKILLKIINFHQILSKTFMSFKFKKFQIFYIPTRRSEISYLMMSLGTK